MNRKLGILAGLCALLVGVQARADVFTEVGTWNRAAFPPGAGADFNNFQQVTYSGGAIYNNTTGTNFISVGAVPLVQLIPFAGASSFNITGSNTTNALAVFGLQGSLSAGPSGPALLQSGVLNIYQIPDSTFVTNDPRTWGALTNAGAFTTANRVAQFVLKAQENILKGDINSKDTTTAAANTNIITPNATNPALLAGTAIFRAADGQTLNLYPGQTSPLGAWDSPLLENLTTGGLDLTNNFIDAEGIVLNNFSETIQVVGGAPPANYTLSATALNDLTTLLNGLGLPGFQSGSSYSVNPLAGDFPSSVDGGAAVPILEVVPKNANIPEPATLSLLVLSAAGLAGVRVLRNRKRLVG